MTDIFLTKCECDLRDRQWNGFGRCLHCGSRYVDDRSALLAREPSKATIEKIGSGPGSIALRPERVLLPPSDIRGSYLLEVFELGAKPLGSGARHAVWLHILEAGGYRWECCCGAQRTHHEIDAALLAEARAHFDQGWEPAAVPIWHPVTIWNDRATKQAPPSTADLEQLAKELTSEMRKNSPRR